jgi:hypothetical protein
MAVILYLPYTYVTPNGTQIPSLAPTVDSFPITPDERGNNLILTVQKGVYAPGAYQWVDSRWQFILPYETVCQQLFGLSANFVCVPNVGDNLLPIGNSGAANVDVYRNSVQITGFSLQPQGVALPNPASRDDVYVVVQWSPIKPTDSITGGGGIPDAPTDGQAYVRKNLAWEQLQSEVNEGQFTGH